MSGPTELAAGALATRMAAHGFVAADDEAAELVRSAGGDAAALHRAVERRLAGEPLPWVTGSVEVDGLRLVVEPDTYVPRRWQTPAVAHRAAARLPAGGTAVDLCTGVGTVAALLRRADPTATVVGTDVDATAVGCARRNGVDARRGHLYEPLPAALAGTVDVVTAVAPYVPTAALALLPAESRRHEPRRSLDGGADGLALVRAVVTGAPAWLRPGGWLVVELGVDQVAALAGELRPAGWCDVAPVRDADGAPCGLEARWPQPEGGVSARPAPP